MGYRDDFYVAENLIGYTGSPHKMPSVYFLKGTEFGHITQFHPLPLNIGREEVYASRNYTIKNEQTPDGLVCVERANGKAFHTSRNLFIEVGGLTVGQRAILLQSITKFPEKKTLATLKSAEKKAVLTQHDHRLDMLNQIDGGRR